MRCGPRRAFCTCRRSADDPLTGSGKPAEKASKNQTTAARLWPVASAEFPLTLPPRSFVRWPRSNRGQQGDRADGSRGIGLRAACESGAVERPRHPRLGLPDRRGRLGRPARLVPRLQHHRQSGAAEDRQRLPLSGARGGLRDRRHHDRLLAGQHLCPRHLRRHAEHAEGVRPRRHHGDHPRHPARRRPTVEQLAARQDLRMVRRGLPQRAAAALAVPVLQADQRGLPRTTPGDRRVVELRVPVQPRALLPGADCRSDPQVDGRRAADRHRWRVGRCIDGRGSARTRPASPSRRSRRASAW